MHPVNDAPQCHTTHGALVAYRYTYACPSRRTLHAVPQDSYSPLSIDMWNDVGDPVFDGVGQASCESRVNVFLLAYAARFLFVF